MSSMLGGHLGTVIASVAGAGLAVLAAVGVTSAFTSSPPPVDKPYIVYGSSSDAASTNGTDTSTSTDTATPTDTSSAAQ